MKELIDTTAGEQDWWNPEELRCILDLLMEKTEEQLRELMRKLDVQEPEGWFHEYYAALRIRTKLQCMDYADALDFVNGCGGDD